ncbi:MAG TPA: hypothetical protein GYA10_14015 [Alphaproteobacteria bacterium]|nr:hypothetical protein [Alphaproteobacteria bacterium]
MTAAPERGPADVPIVRQPLRHPRRLGFIAFNIIAAGLFVLWLTIRSNSAEAGIAGIPYYALTTAGIIVLAAVWAGSWIAWGFLVWSRRRRRQRQ